MTRSAELVVRAVIARAVVSQPFLLTPQPAIVRVRQASIDLIDCAEALVKTSVELVRLSSAEYAALWSAAA
jgi:hypothetical protein